MPTVSPCPDAGRWGELLDSRLPEPTANALTSHLEDCSGCQRTLDRLTASESTWAEDARELAERPRPALRKAIAQLKADTEVGLDTAGPAAPGTQTLPFLKPPTDPAHLGRLGPYEVVKVLGRGGMGVVLKAFDPSLHRLVAIKVLAPQWASHPEARQRFEREARAAARVRHANVVAIHAVEEADGLPYLVMEYVPGKSLQQILDRKGPLDIEEVFRIGAEVATGLAAAHDQGLVHRDVKPANILLDKEGNVRLTDFGLARAVDDTTLTQTGTIAGTPQYMAPEQARGAAVDDRADQFSLGSVLYAMCAGRPPFRASSTVAVLKRVCEDETRDVRELNPDVPVELADIIDKLHAKRPSDRFKSTAQVARLLDRYLAHLRSPDKVPKPRAVDLPRASGSRWLWAIALVVPGALVAALLAWAAVHYLSPRNDGKQEQPNGQGGQGVAVQPKPAPRPVPPIEGDPFFKQVWADLHSDEYWPRKSAVERLAGMKPNDQRAKVTPRLAELTNDPEYFIRNAAIKALGVWGTEEDVPVLMRALAHQDPGTRNEALKVIGRFHDPRTLEPVMLCFREFSTRRDAAETLRELGPMAESDVLAILNERDELRLLSLKQAAIEVLADIGTEKSVPALEKETTSDNIHHRGLVEAAKKALMAIAGRKNP
jgi:serine/threonine protein kinase